ncbi:MAG: GNAT family N-acetyltransferase [Bdellovibrionia bacterium]
MSKPNCRIATLGDLPQLVELRILMQKEVNASSADRVDPSFPAALEKYFIQAMGNGSYVSAVAEMDGKLVSTNGLIIYHKPPSITGGDGRVGYVSNVYTLPEWRGRGIASELMKLIVSFAKESRLDKLHLGATDSGIGVYERVGFRAPRFPQLEMKL